MYILLPTVTNSHGKRWIIQKQLLLLRFIFRMELDEEMDTIRRR